MTWHPWGESRRGDPGDEERRARRREALRRLEARRLESVSLPAREVAEVARAHGSPSCPACGEPGHMTSTCPRLADVEEARQRAAGAIAAAGPLAFVGVPGDALEAVVGWLS